jgi:predicted ribosomally synthesized peptide with SipW-like signal peptide
MSIVVGMTYALFTDTVSVKNHLQAGNLDVSLKRTMLTYSVLDENGVLKTETVDQDYDFTETTEKNIFGLESENLKIVPGSFFEATLQLDRHDSVAFNYSVELRQLEGSSDLANQIDVTVKKSDGTTVTKKLSEFANGETISMGSMDGTDTTEAFVVRVEFKDDANNNAAKLQTVTFDLIVKAEQATA